MGKASAAQPFEPGFEEAVKRHEQAKREMSYIPNLLGWLLESPDLAEGVPGDGWWCC